MAANPTQDVQDLDIGDEPYESAEDEDFQLDDVHDESDASASEDEDAGPAKKKRRTKVAEEDAEELDSGDEVTIQKAKEKKRKGKKSKSKRTEDDDDMDFDDEGGPGGFVRTRAMKMRSQEERKPLAKIDGATIDVDTLWEKMNTPGTDSGLLPSQNENKAPTPTDENKDIEMEQEDASEAKRQTQYPDEFIKIKRTYKFAGEMITEEKIVPKDSAEAKVFQASEGNADTLTAADVEDASNAKAIKLRRPLRKISRFDPNPTGSIQRSWEKRPVTGTTTETENIKGPKINTVEKSRLDWAAYVDQAGIKDELRVHSKAKEGYHGRMEFLDRVGAKQDEERRNAYPTDYHIYNSI